MLFLQPAPARFCLLHFLFLHVYEAVHCFRCCKRKTCIHSEIKQSACHRNSCTTGWVWMMRENSKAFTEIPSLTRPGHTSDGLLPVSHSYNGDTIMPSSADTNMSGWLTSGNGDCFATFKYGVFADKYHPVLLLKE